MSKIIPSLWFADNNCEEAVSYYVSVFPNSKILSIEYYPDESLSEHFKGMSGKVFNAQFILDGQHFMAIDGGPYFRFNESISFIVPCENQEMIDYYWEKLPHVPESEQCGWCKDKFGLSWQIVPENIENMLQSESQIKTFLAMKKINIAELEAVK